MTDRDPPQRAHDRVEVVERLVRQPGQAQRHPLQVLHAVGEAGAQVLVQLHVLGLLHQLQQRRQQRRHQHHRQHRERPRQHRREQQPAARQQAEHRRRHQAAAQVVEDLPARQRGQRVAAPAVLRGRRPRQQPRQQLPVAANPAMPSAHVGTVAGRVFLEQLHVAEQARACVATLDQVVAEDAVFRKAAIQRALERVDRVNALADERALAEHVLIDVRNHLRVRVDAGIAAVQLRVARARGAGQADPHARLQDRVAADHAAAHRVVHGAVERMVDAADEGLRGVARQLGVGVQGDHVLHRAERVDVADDAQEAAVAVAAQQRVEVGQLAALALVAHPALFAGVPAARTVKQEKAIRLDAGVALVEPLDAPLREPQQDLVARQGFAVGVGEVGEQGEMQVLVAVAEEAHLQRLDQLLHVADAGQDARHRHQGARAGRDAVDVVHARQRLRRDRQRGHPVEQAGTELAGQQQRHHADRQQPAGRQLVFGRGHDQRLGESRAQYHQQAEVDRHRRAVEVAAQPLAEVRAHAQLPLQLRPAAVDQIPADMPRQRRRRLGRRRDAAQFHRGGGHAHLVQPMLARQPLHHVAVAVAGGEVHLRVDAGRVLAQLLLDQAHALDEIAPVDRRQQAQAADAVAHAHLCRGLLLRLALHQVLDALAGFGQALLDPAQRQRQRRALALQPARHLGHERAVHRRVGARHVGDHQHHRVGCALGGGGHRVGPARGLAAVAPVGHHPRGHAAQVLDQRQPQHDRDRPQLAQSQRSHFLVGVDETVQAGSVDAAVAVRDDLQRDVIDPRQAGRGAVVQPRQFAAVALGQVPAGDADLLLDQVEVVQQPFGRRRDPALAPGRLGQPLAAVGDDRLVVGQPAEQQIHAGAFAQAVLASQLAAVLFHLLGIEQLRAQRRLLLRSRAGGHAAAAERLQPAQLEPIQDAADVQAQSSLPGQNEKAETVLPRGTVVAAGNGAGRRRHSQRLCRDGTRLHVKGMRATIVRPAAGDPP